MPLLAYRAKQSTDTSGTGTLVLNAAASNARSFQAAFGNVARRILYMIQWTNGFEYGLGDFDGGNPGSLTRATVLASSNSGALVTLPAGTKDVFSVIDPAAHEVISIASTATLTLADIGNTVVFTGASAATLNLPAAATVPLGAGFMVLNQGTAALTIDPNGAETVNDTATISIPARYGAFVRRRSGAWSAQVMAGLDNSDNLSVPGRLRINTQAGYRFAMSWNGTDGTGFDGNGFTSYLVLGGLNNPTDGAAGILYDRSNGYLSIAQGQRDTLTQRILLRNNEVYIPGVYASTTGASANVMVDPSGTMMRSTSSLKYKKDIQNLPYGLDKLMRLRPVTYQSRAEIDGETVFAGLIAEEVHEAGLPEFVQYNEDGLPDALAYPQMVALCIKAIQELKNENDALRLRVEALETLE